MAKRKCLMTFYPTKCKDNCFNCKCGGAEATKDMYVSIHNVQRVCTITGGAADTDEGEYIAEVIRNNLEDMVIESQPVKHGRWIYKGTVNSWDEMACSCCDGAFSTQNREQILDWEFCPHCGAKMRNE